MIDPRRRMLLRGSIRGATGELQAPLRPPWSIADEAAFQARCTRCNACIEACPYALLSRGDGGFPTIGFAAHGCDLCGKCLGACKTGALFAGENEDPRPWRIAVASGCLAQRQVECRICAETCEPAALRFAPAPGGIAQLHIDAEACNGCGDCVSTCPVGAISMQRPSAKP